MLGPLPARVVLLVLVLLIVKGRETVRPRQARAIWAVHDGQGIQGAWAQSETEGNSQAIREPGIVVIVRTIWMHWTRLGRSEVGGVCVVRTYLIPTVGR